MEFEHVFREIKLSHSVTMMYEEDLLAMKMVI